MMNKLIKQELIDYIIELAEDDDIVCDELHQYESEREYCRDHCDRLREECIIRLMKRRIQYNK